MTWLTIRVDHLVPPEEPLPYPGPDQVGELWQPPPPKRTPLQPLPTGRPPVIAVLGSSGLRASWQTGVIDALEDVADIRRVDAASGGVVPALGLAAGLSKADRRRINAGAPSHNALVEIDGLRWYERSGLDLAGKFHLGVLEKWMENWLAWAGVKTFADLRHTSPERPELPYRVSISVVMWRSRRAFGRRCTPAELADPIFARRAFRWALLSTQFPFKQFQQVWVPDTIGEHLPWLADEIDEHSPAWWARVSMSQWPACTPAVLQDPVTKQLIFVGDGGHIDNQPSQFNTGHPPPYPLINPRLMQHRLQARPQQLERDARRMPFGAVIRFPKTPETEFPLRKYRQLTMQRRDSMWQVGYRQGTERLGDEVPRAIARYQDLASAAGTDGWQPPRLEVPALHGFRLIAAQRRAHTRNVFGFRS